jgi:hypothetical protein
MTPQQKLVEEFRQFYFRWIVPDLCYVVLEPAGGTRFSGQRLGAGLDVAVVGTTSGGLIPVRDHHIYAVVECPAGQHSSTPDAVSMEIGQIIHRTMCGRAKLGRDITLGEIAAAAEAQVAARMADRFHKAPVVDPMGAADRPPGVPAEVTPDLPATAVQICVGDTIRSAAFPTPEAAMASPEWAMCNALPEVVVEKAEVWLRPVSEEDPS